MYANHLRALTHLQRGLGVGTMAAQPPVRRPTNLPTAMDTPAITNEDLKVPSLGPCLLRSPGLVGDLVEESGGWTEDDERILLDDREDMVRKALRADRGALPAIELAGPRRDIFFDPAETCCGIVTCGGLCPGLNDVIRAIVMQAWFGYGVRRVLGLRYGYEGLNPEFGHEPIVLTPDKVSQIHHLGGTVLGTSRGKQDIGVMADHLDALGITMLFVVGGDGSQRGANALYQEMQRRGKKVAVVGVPKTIDNDLPFMDRSFGYETAFTAAFHAVHSAHSEARGARNGIGLVKLMGRDSGFIACSTALATGEANFVLIPEVSFRLEGTNGLFALLENRLATRDHAVIVVAEGAGQDLVGGTDLGTDASGNKKFADIGLFLKDEIARHFQASGTEANVKYIDPSYIIRAVPASPEDRIFCQTLGRHAVHAAMAGKTGLVVARWHQRFVHLPMGLVTRGRRKVDPQGDLWRSVLEATGQPVRIGT